MIPHHDPVPDPVPSYRSLQQGPGDALGILIVNIGTPDAPTAPALRRYLKEFLSDPRVVELPRWLWWFALNAYILRVRPARSAALYRKIWTEQGSPMLLHSLDVARAIEERLSDRLPGAVTVELGMSYGNPSIASALEKLCERRVARIVVLPLYPQYAGPTTGAAFDAVTRALSKCRRVPGFAFIDHYHDATAYIAAIVESVRAFHRENGAGERLLFSFHGLPQQMVDDGDPYYRQCRATARLVAGRLELDEGEWQVSFQSRVGRQEWLKPYTDVTLEQWGEAGMGEVDVVCPGFAVDCLETLEEVAMRYKELYASSGGGELRYIPALNDRGEHVEFLSSLIEENVARPPATSRGFWIEDGPSGDPDRIEAGRAS